MFNKKKRILLIIPAYNEEENILKTCKTIKKCNKDLAYIVINDGSKDSSGEIAKAYAGKYPEMIRYVEEQNLKM